MKTGHVLKNIRVIALLVLLLAGACALIDFTTNAFLSGQYPVPNYFRWLASKLLSSGTVWAGLAFYAGYRFAGRGKLVYLGAPLAGVVALLATLVAHYGIKVAFGIDSAET